MRTLIAALPMYDWPEVRPETDALWARIRDVLRETGIDAPEQLTRTRGDLQSLWRDPDLLFAQTCWGPMGQGLADHVQLIGQPDYSDVESGEGALYSSAILMRRDEAAAPVHYVAPPFDISPAGWEKMRVALRDWPISPPAGEMSGRTEGGNVEHRVPLGPLAQLLRAKRFAYNSTDSMSGYLALQSDLSAEASAFDLFSGLHETGGHRASILAVAEGRADVCAIDCRSWSLALRHEPAAAKLVPVAWTRKRKGLPYITSKRTPPQALMRMRHVLADARIVIGA